MSSLAAEVGGLGGSGGSKIQPFQNRYIYIYVQCTGAGRCFEEMLTLLSSADSSSFSPRPPSSWQFYVSLGKSNGKPNLYMVCFSYVQD